MRPNAPPGHQHPAYLGGGGQSSLPQQNAEPTGTSAGMNTQSPTTPTVPLPDARNHRPQLRYESAVPPDAPIPTPSPTYSHQFSPYVQPSTADMQNAYHNPASAGLYAQPRPDWSTYSSSTAPMAASHHHFVQQAPAQAVAPRNQVYSFVPIPGAQQHKRPRRRYEEIDRMYKCGWNNCEKAYGTLNHLNAHVTMQGHGLKRTPEEFKEIRKEWKAKKKEEENRRKAQLERHRTATSADSQTNEAPPSSGYTRQLPLPQLPAYTTPGYGTTSSSGLPADYGNTQGYTGYSTSPTSPYGQPGQYSHNNNGPHTS